MRLLLLYNACCDDRVNALALAAGPSAASPSTESVLGYACNRSRGMSSISNE